MLCYVKFMHVTNFDLRLAIPRPAGGRMEFIQLLSHPFSLSVDVVGNCVYTHRTWQWPEHKSTENQHNKGWVNFPSIIVMNVMCLFFGKAERMIPTH